MNVRLNGRAALITGGGIGVAVKASLAASGADVAVLARRASVLEKVRHFVEATLEGRVHLINTTFRERTMP